MKKQLSRKEIDQRVAILKRFKELLQEQRKRFNDYLIVLETQERSISEENMDAILKYTELEESLITDIGTIQKVIDPLEQMYKFSMPEKDDAEVIRLKDDLDKLQDKVIDQNRKNRRLLQSVMTDVHREIVSMQPIHSCIPAQVFAQEESAPSFVDISV